MGNKTVAPAPVTDFHEPIRDQQPNSASISLAQSNSISIASPTRRDTFVTPINRTTSQATNPPTVPHESRRSSGLEIPMTTSEFLPVTSPDTTAVSPTIPVSLLSTKSPTFVGTNKFPINDTQTRSPSRISVPQTNGNLSEKSRFDEIHPPTATNTKTSLADSTMRAGPTKQWYRKTPVEEKISIPERESSSIIEEPKTTEVSRQASTVTVKKPFVPPTREIVAVPSYQLRSTAVVMRPVDQRRSLERTQSMYSTNSTVPLSLYQRPSNQTMTSDHSKSTMFQMDTTTKQTPHPAPSILLLTKDFNDGTLLRESPLDPPPTFASLGLNEDLETDTADVSLLARIHEKQLISQSMNLINYGGPDPYSTTSSSVSEPSERRPLPSILKKPSFQQSRNNFLSYDGTRKTETESNASVVSFNLPPPTGKAIQSISRSEKLISRRMTIRSIS